jgi:hypothetical protein
MSMHMMSAVLVVKADASEDAAESRIKSSSQKTTAGSQILDSVRALN